MNKTLKNYLEHIIKSAQMAPPGMPMDPAMMGGGGGGGGMPMDPAMMAGGGGGGMPMEPAMMGGGGMPMDPAMMGGGGGGMPMDPSMAMGVPGGAAGLPPELMEMMAGLPEGGMVEDTAAKDEALNKALEIADNAMQLVREQTDKLDALAVSTEENTVDPEMAAAIEEARANAMGEM
jgi:hypothetical protein